MLGIGSSPAITASQRIPGAVPIPASGVVHNSVRGDAQPRKLYPRELYRGVVVGSMGPTRQGGALSASGRGRDRLKLHPLLVEDRFIRWLKGPNIR